MAGGRECSPGGRYHGSLFFGSIDSGGIDSGGAFRGRLKSPGVLSPYRASRRRSTS
jgi:hypothetical protein